MLQEPTTDKMIFGVCRWISKSFGIPVLILRALFLVTAPVSIFVYILLVGFTQKK
ncbi:PspC domain-containing protein [Sutcliffiella deserti]|uniref:PspC domain-containing protein n=1 Tax=Sutcliffiella deserti TaxID=2875501 RepID=UPI001CBD5B44|nr:PspC domain-containing protein [Sutcliffiella deserti]